MNVRWSLLIVGIVISAVTACGDVGPGLIKHDTDNLVLFKRVTLASDARGRAEIEIEVRTGSDFSRMAPDGTVVVLETSHGSFANGLPRIEVETAGGHAVEDLTLPGPSRLTITARSKDAVSRLDIDVNDDGSVMLDPH